MWFSIVPVLDLMTFGPDGTPGPNATLSMIVGSLKDTKHSLTNNNSSTQTGGPVVPVQILQHVCNKIR